MPRRKNGAVRASQAYTQQSIANVRQVFDCCGSAEMSITLLGWRAVLTLAAISFSLFHSPRGLSQAGDELTTSSLGKVRVIFEDKFDEKSQGLRIRNTIIDPEPDGLAYKSDTPLGYKLKNWIIADPNSDDARRSFWCIPERKDGSVETYAQQAGRSKNSIAYASVPVPKDVDCCTIEFRQWCNDNDYIGFVIGASKPSIQHDGIEFGYTRQLPGTDTTVKDAFLTGALGERKVQGQALRKRWVQHRIEVKVDHLSWFQDHKLMGDKKVEIDSHGYFGIRHRFERGTRYGDFKISVTPRL